MFALFASQRHYNMIKDNRNTGARSGDPSNLEKRIVLIFLEKLKMSHSDCSVDLVVNTHQVGIEHLRVVVYVH